MRVALIANASDADAGLVGRSLRRRGCSFVEFLREDHERWSGLDGIDLVVAMGSSWSTYWDHVAAPVASEQRLMAEAIERGVAVLGICFGAQQLSTVLGGQVTRADRAEIGWHDIHEVPETSNLAPPELCSGPWMQWHYDRFSVPPGATVLAESSVGPQAFVHGRACGVQFHPEATESIVRTWASGDGEQELTEVGLTTAGVVADTAGHLEDAQRRCDALVEWFLTSIAQRHMNEPSGR